MNVAATGLYRPAPDPAPAMPGVAAAACFHCGLAVSTGERFQVLFDGKSRTLCCAGCEAVAKTILDAGLAAYYRERTSAPAAPATVTDEAIESLFGLTGVQAQYVAAAGEHTRTAELYVDGITCSACVWLAESALAKVPGVTRASVNQITHRASVAWRAEATSFPAILNALSRVGLKGQPAAVALNFAARRQARRRALIELGVALLSMMQVMMFTYPLYFSAPGDVSFEARQLMGWAALVLTLPAILYSARTFFIGAWRDVSIGRIRRISMDLPVAIAIAATFTTSAIALIHGSGVMYFDSVSMFIFLLLAARYLELWARESSLALIERLTNAAPATAWVMPDFPAAREGHAIASAELKPGQVIRVACGEMVAADGIIVEGRGEFDESLLTGESTPLVRGAGDLLVSGSLNVGSPVFMRITRSGEQTTGASLRRLTEQALAARATLHPLADRIAQWIAPATLGLSAAAALVWMMIDASMSFPVAVAVLAVTCPCALALAAPAAQALATTRLAREGLLVARAGTLEKIAGASDIVFDKTGTLTTGEVAIDATALLGSLDLRQVLAVAVALEAGSPHPIARALTRALARAVSPERDRAAVRTNRVAAATDVHAVTGAGVEGRIVLDDGTCLDCRLGSEIFVQQWVGSGTPGNIAAEASLFLGCRGEWLAAFTLADPLKADAADTLLKLSQRGLTVHLLSGDRQDRVDDVARQLHLQGAHVSARQTPRQKFDYAAALKQRDARTGVIAIGDGINDAPLLGAADVSIAIGSGADLTLLTADAVLLSPHLHPLLTAQNVARRMVRIIHQNFAWAVAYNVIAVPLAMCGKISPAAAAIGMAVSSLAVVGNSLRLLRRGRGD